jgi:hypothetical protein
MNGDSFYILLDDKVKGPFDRDQIFMLLGKGEINKETLIRGENASWARLDSVLTISATPSSSSTPTEIPVDTKGLKIFLFVMSIFVALFVYEKYLIHTRGITLWHIIFK